MENDILYKKARSFLGRGAAYRTLSVLNSTYKAGASHPLVIVTKNELNGMIVAVTVLDASNVRSIPLNGFGLTRQGKTIAANVLKVLDENGYHRGGRINRYDALWIGEGCLSHITNIKI